MHFLHYLLSTIEDREDPIWCSLVSIPIRTGNDNHYHCQEPQTSKERSIDLQKVK